MEPVLYIGIAQTIFAAILICTKKQKQLADIILTIWLSSISVQMIWVLRSINTAESGLSGFLYILSFPLTYGPFLYIYTRLLVSKDRKFETFKTKTLILKYLPHFIPFFCFLVILLFYSPDFKNIIFSGKPPVGERPPLIFIILGFCTILSIFIYVSVVWQLIRKYTLNIPEYACGQLHQIKLNWLKTITLVFALTFSSLIALDTFQIVNKIMFLNPVFLHFSGLTVFAFTISYFGFKQPDIFSKGYLEKNSSTDKEVISRISEDPGNKKKENSNKYEKSGLKEEDANYYMETLLDYMKEEKPFLLNNLTINTISGSLNIPRHYITQVLSEKLNKNFYTFVNEFRICEFKDKIKNPHNSHITIMGLAYESGFNSKAGFYSAFKKIENKTPTEYRNQLQNNIK